MLTNNMLRITLITFICLSTTVSYVYAEKSSREQLQRDINVLGKRLSVEEKKAASVRSEVRKLEKILGEQTRKSYSFEKKIKKIGKRLEQTTAEKKVLEAQLDVQKKGLSQQIQALYTAGEQSHLRLLLKQDDPSDIGRSIKYIDYLNKNRLKKIKVVKETIIKLNNVEKSITRDREELVQLNNNLLVQKRASKKTLGKRTSVYKKLKKNVNYKKRQLKELRRKEAKLQKKINRLVENTKKNEQVAAQPTQQKKKKNSPNKPTKNNSKAAVVGKKQRFTPDKKFSSLRGKLSWPVRGKMIHSYGERRNEKQRWKGTVIAAPGGQKVRAVARGKVEFSGWFNGYGYLVIIRHDNNYRSLYGYNRAVYVKAGQVVRGGATIAAVGNSGGQQTNALYFEIRKGVSQRNPAKWCR